MGARYTEAWMDRTRDNDGIIPDNVGPTGKVGEQRNGQWWGGFYGWNSRNSARMLFGSDHRLRMRSVAYGRFRLSGVHPSQIEFLLSLAKRGKMVSYLYRHGLHPTAGRGISREEFSG